MYLISNEKKPARKIQNTEVSMCKPECTLVMLRVAIKARTRMRPLTERLDQSMSYEGLPLDTYSYLCMVC